MIEVNSLQLQKNLSEVNYPVTKHDLIMHAEEKGADEGVLRAFKTLPSKQYGTPAEVTTAIDENKQ